MVRSPLIHPSRYFEQYTASSDGAVAIVLITGILSVSSGLPVAIEKIEPESSAALLLFFGIVGGILGAVLIWSTMAFGAYVLTRFGGGTGSVRTVAIYVAWGLSPLLLMNVFSCGLIWSWYIVGDLTIRLLPAFTPDSVSSVLFLFRVVAALWVGYVLTHAIRHATNVSVKHAAMTAGFLASSQLLAGTVISSWEGFGEFLVHL